MLTVRQDPSVHQHLAHPDSLAPRLDAQPRVQQPVHQLLPRAALPARGKSVEKCPQKGVAAPRSTAKLSSEGPWQPAVSPRAARMLAVPPVVPQVMLVVPDEAGAGAGEVGEEELPGSPDLLRGCLGWWEMRLYGLGGGQEGTGSDGHLHASRLPAQRPQFGARVPCLDPIPAPQDLHPQPQEARSPRDCPSHRSLGDVSAPPRPFPKHQTRALGGHPLCAHLGKAVSILQRGFSVQKRGLENQKKGVGGWGALHTGDLTLRNVPPGGDV